MTTINKIVILCFQIMDTVLSCWVNRWNRAYSDFITLSRSDQNQIRCKCHVRLWRWRSADAHYGLDKFSEFRWCSIFRLDALALSVIATATWLAGWLAVTLRYCIKTAKPIGKLFRPSESPIILVFWDPCGGVKYTGGGWKLAIFVRFSTYIAVYLGNGAR